MPAASLRARVRAEMTEEIKATARRHLAGEGANLSLRAVAREMGMVSSALYRYFASRDELLTALIVDGYNALGEAVEGGDAAVADRTDLRGRWMGLCRAARAWALANPAEYALLFGSPVPGYAAPQDTVAAASRTTAVMIGIVADGVAAGTIAEPATGELPANLSDDFTTLCRTAAPGVPEALMARGTVAWVHLFGALNFEIFGRLDAVVAERETYFEYQMLRMADLIGV